MTISWVRVGKTTQESGEVDLVFPDFTNKEKSIGIYNTANEKPFLKTSMAIVKCWEKLFDSFTRVVQNPSPA